MGLRRWLANQIQTLIDGVTPPIVEKTAQADPGIFSLIDLCYHLSNRMGSIGKWYGYERLLFSNLFSSLLILPQIRAYWSKWTYLIK
jgi:hypothetical protein